MSDSNSPSVSRPLLSNEVYNVAKEITTVVLPALGTLYFALSGLWNLPDAKEVVGTIAAVTVFLGVVLHLSTISYNNSSEAHDGFLTVTGVDEVTEHPDLQLTLTKPPEDLVRKKSVKLKIKS